MTASAETVRNAGARFWFWLLAVILLFYKLGDTAPWQSEDRWLEIASEMIDSGNYFSPTINGAVYFDKPLLSYWLEIAAAKLVGGFGEFAMRLPSAVAALIALWASIDLGKRLWSDRIGTLSGWILLTCFGFLQWGRLGEADMENLAATIVAVDWYWARRERTKFFSYLIFYFVIAVGAQCKGLAAAAVPLLAVLAQLLIDKRWKSHINPAHFLAAASALAVYLLPFLLAAQAEAPGHGVAGTTGIGLVIRENIVRYFAPFDHTGPIYTYLIAVPQYVFPWSLVLIAALVAAFRKTFHDDPNLRWNLYALVFIFLFFTLSGSRRNYYILPILPYCALLCAYFLRDPHSARARRWILCSTIALLSLFSLVQATAPLLWPQLEQRAGAALPRDIASISGAIGLIALLGPLSTLRWRRQEFAPTAIIATSIALWGGFFFWQQPALDHYRTEARFARDLQLLSAPEEAMTAAIYRDKPSGRLLYYSNLQLPVLQIENGQQLRQFLQTPPFPKLILTDEKYKGELPEELRHRQPDLAEKRQAWEKHFADKMLAWRIGAATDPIPPAAKGDRDTRTPAAP